MCKPEVDFVQSKPAHTITRQYTHTDTRKRWSINWCIECTAFKSMMEWYTLKMCSFLYLLCSFHRMHNCTFAAGNFAPHKNMPATMAAWNQYNNIRVESVQNVFNCIFCCNLFSLFFWINKNFQPFNGNELFFSLKSEWKMLLWKNTHLPNQPLAICRCIYS